MSRRKWILSLLLFVLFEILVVLGCRFWVDESNFLLAVAVFSALGLTILVVYILVSRLTRRMGGGTGGGSQAAAPAAPPQPAPVSASGPDPEIDAVLGLISEANTRLAQSPTLSSRRIRTSVTGLPMYLLLGPEGSGKTTTFLGAGLEPELLAGQVYRDSSVVPTKICNFWYAGDSAFIETSGTFFSQEPARWVRLLKHLRGKGAGSFFSKLLPGGKTKTNLRGAVLFADISPFLGIPDAARIGGLARRIQERLRLIGEGFSVHFPVYVVFTKSDGVPYFAEYFTRLGEGEDQQILGCTLPVLTASQRPTGEVFAESEGTRLSEAFNGLYFSLADKRMRFLSREPVAERKIPTYEFPREVKRVRDTLVQFLVDVFRPNPLQPSPILRGFYFTGVRQVAASSAGPGAMRSVQRGPNTGEATSLFDLKDYQKKSSEPAQERQGEPTIPRWTFVSELFHRVILADRLERVAGFRHRKLDLYRRAAYGALAFLGVAMCLLFIRSWWGNRGLLNDVRTAVQEPYRFQPGPAPAVPAIEDLRAMDSIRQQIVRLEDLQGWFSHWHLGWGLYSGNRVLPDTRALYFRRFRGIFFDDFYTKLQRGLGRLPATSDSSVPYDTAYDWLRAYRMVSTSCKCSPDKKFLTDKFYRTWGEQREPGDERERLIRAQLEFYADELARKNPYDNVEENGDLVKRAQGYISSTHGPDQIYASIINEVNGIVAPARISDLSPDYQKALSGPGQVDGAFTARGIPEVESRIENGVKPHGLPCVIGAEAAIGGILHVGGGDEAVALQSRYWQDYKQRWENFASQTRVLPFSNPDDAAKKLTLLSDTRSPILAAVALISRNTNFPPPQGGSPAGATGAGALSVGTKMQRGAQAGGLFSGATSKVSKLEAINRAASGSGSASTALKAPPATRFDVSKVFQPAQAVTSPTVTDRLVDSPNTNYMSALATLQQSMDTLKDDRASNPNQAHADAAKSAAQAGQKTVLELAGKFNTSGTDGMDTILADFLKSPFSFALKFIPDQGALAKDKATGAGKTFCAALGKLQRKFPFDPQGTTDASVDEFTTVFGSQNSAYATLQQALSKSIVKQGKVWTSAPDADPKLSDDYIRFLNRVGAISDAFFPPDANGQAKLHYGLKIEPLPNVEKITLTVDGDSAVATSTSSTKQFIWPGTAAKEANLQVKIGGTQSFGRYAGDWAIFKLMANADTGTAARKAAQFSKTRGQGSSLSDVVTDKDGKPVTVTIDIDAAANVFDLSFFWPRCPGRVTE